MDTYTTLDCGFTELTPSSLMKFHQEHPDALVELCQSAQVHLKVDVGADHRVSRFTVKDTERLKGFCEANGFKVVDLRPSNKPHPRPVIQSRKIEPAKPTMQLTWLRHKAYAVRGMPFHTPANQDEVLDAPDGCPKDNLDKAIFWFTGQGYRLTHKDQHYHNGKSFKIIATFVKAA